MRFKNGEIHDILWSVDPLLFAGSLDLVVDGRHGPGAVILSEGRKLSQA